MAREQQYEADRTSAIDAAGLPDAIERPFWASQEIDDLARKAADIKPRTFAGAIIMARALCAYAETEAYSGNRQWGVMILGKPLAEAVARLG
jgi:tellurite resistance protein